MLSYQATNDKALLSRLSSEIFNKPYYMDTGFVLYHEATPIGISALKITPSESVVIEIGVLKEFRGKGYGDYFTRALLNNLSYVSKTIKINYRHDYFVKFGFSETNSGMEILSGNLTFPCKCKN
ncbi:MAG: GNAT family N-acetyltransferase [Firmicutes bacterium]|nr:GNAT family N-acetyltransferase [Bacillota bacterium]